jgi:hypothetical protein
MESLVGLARIRLMDIRAPALLATLDKIASMTLTSVHRTHASTAVVAMNLLIFMLVCVHLDSTTQLVEAKIALCWLTNAPPLLARMAEPALIRWMIMVVTVPPTSSATIVRTISNLAA